MKLQRTTILLLVAALLLSGAVFVLEIQGRPTREAAQAKQQQIFTFSEQQVQSLKITTKSQTLEMTQVKPTKPQGGKQATAKENIPSPSVVWNLQAPVQSPANAATIAYLLSLLAGEKRDRSLKVAPAELAEMGLDKPTTILEIILTNQKTHRLWLGNPDFTGQYLYARIDPANTTPQEVTVDLVPISLRGAIDRPLADWKVAQEPANKPNENDPAKPEQSPTKPSSERPSGSQQSSQEGPEQGEIEMKQDIKPVDNKAKPTEEKPSEQPSQPEITAPTN